MNKQETLKLIQANINQWEKIENPETLNEFLQWVQNVNEKEWNKHEKRVNEVIQDYNELTKIENEKPEELTSINFEEIKKQSLIEQKYSTNKEKFIKYFSYYSVHNEDYASVLYHNLISVMAVINNVKIKTLNNQNVTPISHCFIIQGSGTGKDQGMDFFINIINKLNKKISEYNGKVSTNKIRNILLYEWSGSETVETLVDGFEIGKDGKPKVKDKNGNLLPPIKGILSKYDLIVSRECSFLFKQKISGDGKNQKIDSMLLALEGKPDTKNLISWRLDGIQYSTITIFNGVFIGTSRPVANMKAHLAWSGLQQRGLNICRRITSTDRKLMDDKLAVLRCLKRNDWVMIERGIDGLVNDFFGMLLFLKGTIPVIVEDNKGLISGLIKMNISMFRFKVDEEIEDEDQQEILNSFISRFQYHVDVLAFHNAVCRLSGIVELVDYQNALNLLCKCFDYLRVWVERTVEIGVNVRGKREQDRRIKLFDFFRRHGGVVELKFLVGWCCSCFGVNRNQGYVIVNAWVRDGVLLVRNGLLVFNLDK